ncbi:MAG: S4 domain-containing protein, partial [Bacteroidales bacterium]
MRIDKYLWSIRIFKTRTQAGEACRTGHVRIGEDVVKASREIKIGDKVKIHTNGLTKTIEILAEIKTRVGSAEVSKFALDLT